MSAIEDKNLVDATIYGSAVFGAIRPHKTAMSDLRYVGPLAIEKNVKSPNTTKYFDALYAWRDESKNPNQKVAYRFHHHFLNSDGSPGAASRVAVSSGIGILNGARGGTTIPTADRKGVYDHLSYHLTSAGRTAPQLLSQEDYEFALKQSNMHLALSLTIKTDGKIMDSSEVSELVSGIEELAALSDDALLAELARRWAEKTVDSLAGEVNQFGHEDSSAMSECTHEEECDCDKEYGEIVVTLPPGTCVVVEAEDSEESAYEDSEVVTEGVVDEGEEIMQEGDKVTSQVSEILKPVAASQKEPISFTKTSSLFNEDSSVSLYDWEGVLIVEGIASGDGRKIAENALTWRELPLPLMLQTANASGHDGAVIAGSIHEIERQGQNIVGRGFFDSGTAGVEAHRLLKEGTMRGVSADIDSVTIEFMTADGNTLTGEDMMFGGVESFEVLTSGRMMGATLTPFPAFQEAFVTVLTNDQAVSEESLVASGSNILGDVWRVPSPLGVWLPGEGNAEHGLAALVASAAALVEVPTNPPMDWFLPGDMSVIEPFTVRPDGRCYGLVAAWGSCHIGFTDRCVPVPKSGCAYKHFRNKNVLTAEGTLVATGAVYMDTVHPNLRAVASDAQAFYADTGCAVADVALYENEFGIVAAGALRPGLSAEQVRRFRGSDVSPDWRQLNGRLEVVGLLSVNVSGFIVEGLVASGAEVSAPRGVWDSVAGEVTSLVAAGMIHTADTERSDLRRELDSIKLQLVEFREALRPVRAERAAAKFASLPVSTPGKSGCSCNSVH